MSEVKSNCFASEPNRRDFLHFGGCFIIGLAALGLPSSLAALPVVETSGAGGPSEKHYPVPAGDSVNIDRQAQVILVRFQNNVYAFSLACPHEHASIKWLQKDRRFQCSKHDSKYQPNGTYTSGRATRNLDRFVLRKEETNVVVDLQHWFESDKNPSGWASAFVSV